jgi:hypothetical protein
MRAALFLIVFAACAAPPMGLGPGARLPARPGYGQLAGSVGMGAGPGRQMFQAEGSMAFRAARWFDVDVGGVYTQIAQRRADGTDVTVAGGFPYVRPRVVIDHVSVAVALSGFGMGGGGGGFAGGVADVQLGYGTAAWSVYAGAYGQAFELVADNGLTVSSSQLRLGGEYTTRMGPSRVGVAVEVYRHHDTITRDTTTESRFIGAGLKLTITSSEIR